MTNSAMGTQLVVHRFFTRSDYVTFGYMLSQVRLSVCLSVCLSSATFMRPAVDVGPGISRVSCWLLPAPAAASDCSMPVWGHGQNFDPGCHQYSAGLLQLAVLRHSRWFDEPLAVSSERRRTSHHQSQAVRSHHASPMSAALVASPQTSGF